MKRLSIFVGLFTFLLAVFLSVAAFAQVATDPAPDIATLISQALSVVTTWKSAGAVAALLIVVNLLTNITKLGPISNLLDRWAIAKPLVSVILGVLGGIFASLTSGAGILPSILAGVVAGLGGVGFHELISLLNSGKQVERAAGYNVVMAVKDANAAAKVAPLTAKLTEIAAMPDEKARLKALADWANQ